MKARTRTAGRTSVGLVLAATTVAAMTVPASAAPTAHQPATLGATALALPRVSPVVTVPQAPTAMTYQVRAGDTVSHIALRTSTSVAEIVRANNLNSRAQIKAGQTLRIPVPGSGSGVKSSSSATSSSASRSHTVAAGDTVSGLAKRYGTTVSAIVSANKLDSRALIIVGQRLSIPGTSSSSGSSSSSASSSSSFGSSSSSSASSHRVVAGDTVSGLAKRYGTTVSAIASANGLNSRAVIYVGQRLTLPGASSGSSSSGSSSSGSSSGSSSSGSSSSGSTASSHRVTSGETVSGLASRYGTTVSAIASANNLGAGAVIYVGQRLTIPGASGTKSSGGGTQLVGNTFLGRTYSNAVVSAANTNKATLNSMSVPSRDAMRQMVRNTAVQMGVDPALALAIAQQESGFDARAVSPANAVGTMQVIPSSGAWASELVGRDLNLLDPQDNVVAGVAILRQLRRAAPSLDIAIAGYYQGLAGVTRNGMYADTRNYVSGIRNLMQRY